MAGLIHSLDHADNVRLALSPLTAQSHKSEFGQFMTPSSVARFMASLFPPSQLPACRLLDAGAGVGALSCAFLDRWQSGGFGFEMVDAFAYEIDGKLHAHLARHLSAYQGVTPHVIGGDFIALNTQGALLTQGGYTHAILNPPYKKINSSSLHRRALRTVGIETVNLYSAFVALAVELAAPGGQIVAIIPRSFCNGPYYRPFRDYVLARASLCQMHLFEARNKAFKDDDVLQESIIVRFERGGRQGTVTVSTSTDDSFSDMMVNEHPFNRIVFPEDLERFIHVPTTLEKSSIELSDAAKFSLADIGVKVSTGPVVDFRLKDHLRDTPEPGTVPLLYPGHFSALGTEWPKPDSKKPNAIQFNDDTRKWLYPNGFYCVVRRFSAKEERRRIVASLVDPADFDGAPMLGFENHLNVFHEEKHGLPVTLAAGLAAFLNTTAVDESFRRFNGHTQVNATDLRLLKYPSRANLMRLGEWAMAAHPLTQAMLDAQFEGMTA